MTETQFNIIRKDCPWYVCAGKPRCQTLDGMLCNIHNCSMVFWLSIHVDGVENFLHRVEK